MIDIPYEEWSSRDKFGKSTKAPVWCIGADVALPSRLFLRCGGCKAPVQIVEHSVTLDGVVHPSILHKCNPVMQEYLGMPKAEWHVYGRLLDWRRIVGKPKLANQDVT